MEFIDRSSFALGIMVGILGAMVGRESLRLLVSFLVGAWNRVKARRQRRRWAKEPRVMWQSIPDHFNCRCTLVPLDDRVDDDDETPTEIP